MDTWLAELQAYIENHHLARIERKLGGVYTLTLLCRYTGGEKGIDADMFLTRDTLPDVIAAIQKRLPAGAAILPLKKELALEWVPFKTGWRGFLPTEPDITLYLMKRKGKRFIMGGAFLPDGEDFEKTFATRGEAERHAQLALNRWMATNRG